MSLGRGLFYDSATAKARIRVKFRFLVEIGAMLLEILVECLEIC